MTVRAPATPTRRPSAREEPACRVTGRPRDASIDRQVLAVALEHLAERGLTGMSVAAVADAAGTTRPAVYRRWATKEDLAIAAVAAVGLADPPQVTGDAFADLLAEVEHFRACIEHARSLTLVGVMLTDGTADAVRAAYREHLVVPRRGRLRARLEAGVQCGDLPTDADLDLATTLVTGSWYALALTGQPAPDDWAARIARATWRACGGIPPV